MKPFQLRSRALAEWRGLPERRFPEHNAKQVSETLDKVLAKWGLSARLREEDVLRAWQEIVGDFVSRHSTPQGIKEGVLTVRVLQPTVHYELDRIWKKEILAKLKARFGAGAVREIKFRIG